MVALRTRPRSVKPPRLGYIKSLLPTIACFGVFVGGLTVYFYLSTTHPKQAHHWGSVEVQGQGGSEGEIELTNLPLDVWDPIARHASGLSEITTKFCIVSPSLIPCKPFSTPKDDQTRGKWVMVGPNINAKRLGGGVANFLNIWYRRSLHGHLITDIATSPSPPGEGWTSAGNLHRGTGDKSLYLWYKTNTGKENNTAYITELSVHYGDDPPFFGFERVPGRKVAEGEHSVDVVYRRGNPQPPKAGSLAFNDGGEFKIMQIADMHYSTGKGHCRDARSCEGDHTTAKWLAEALDAEKPDLVVFTGDQLNGEGTTFDSMSVLAKFATPVIDRKIPWAAIFGNHDSEMLHDRKQQMAALEAMPYSLSRAGPADVDGVGNYDLAVYANDYTTRLFSLYFLDSHAYKPGHSPITWLKTEYDNLKQSQVDWYLNVSAAVPPIDTPFNPAPKGPKRIRNSKKPNAIMFFHIPTREAYFPPDEGTEDVGQQLEEDAPADVDTPMIKSMGEDSDVKVIAHGHNHLTDRCRRVSGIWMCFAGGSGFGGYGRKTFERRVRIFDVSNWGEKIVSYKRTISGKIVDHQVLLKP